MRTRRVFKTGGISVSDPIARRDNESRVSKKLQGLSELGLPRSTLSLPGRGDEIARLANQFRTRPVIVI
jgi:hypothetical protein